MKYYVISEEDLKDFIRTSKRYGFACECVFYHPSEKELEVTEENLKRFTELKEYIKEHRDEILQDNAEGVRNVELEEDIKHCEEVLADWHGCDECKADHERLLSYMKELLEYRKYMSDKKYEGMKDTNVPVFDLIKNNTVVRIKERKVEEAEVDDYRNIKRDFREFLEELKQFDINISNSIQIYDCILLNDEKDYKLVCDTREYIKKCIKNIESLSFLRDKD